jgi:hypothetical protein
MSQDECGDCVDCTSVDPVWCIEWGQPPEDVLLGMTDRQFGRVSRMMKGRLGVHTDATVVPDPPSHPSESGFKPGRVEGLTFASGYEDDKLPPVPHVDDHLEYTEPVRFYVELPVTAARMNLRREVERKRAEVERALRMTFHDQGLRVFTPPSRHKPRQSSDRLSLADAGLD